MHPLPAAHSTPGWDFPQQLPLRSSSSAADTSNLVIDVEEAARPLLFRVLHGLVLLQQQNTTHTHTKCSAPQTASTHADSMTQGTWQEGW